MASFSYFCELQNGEISVHTYLIVVAVTGAVQDLKVARRLRLLVVDAVHRVRRESHHRRRLSLHDLARKVHRSFGHARKGREEGHRGELVLPRNHGAAMRVSSPCPTSVYPHL